MKYDLIGKRFGKLIVIDKAEVTNDGKVKWLCKCDCGTNTTVVTCNLMNGHTRSCGCLIGKKGTHGCKHTRLYSIWSNMRNRCENPKSNRSRYYFEKGIKVCDEWKKFENFKDWATTHGYKDDLSLERKDISKGYEPGNCCWIPLREQAQNKSTSFIWTNGDETHCLAEWCRIYDMNYGTVTSRIHRNHWDIERALTTPPCR